MSLLYLDTFAGISGDMMLGLLIDLGVERETLQRHLAQLPIAGYRLEQRLEKRHGIAGTRLAVVCDGGQPRRSWAEIDSMLAESSLVDPVKTLARAIFRCLGEAEAHVHRLPPEEVHFHEVGAVDAIVDIVGSAVGLHTLQPERVVCAPLPLTRGLTTGEHGTIPLPAPATLHILHDQPVVWIGGERELVTPTGAAIAVTVAEFGDLPEMTIEQSGYGVGNWELPDRPNLLRGILGTATAPSTTESDRVTILETHLGRAVRSASGCMRRNA
ncbi:MAG: LarC family nickel insertion protein [Desulfuromonadales bacterium]